MNISVRKNSALKGALITAASFLMLMIFLAIAGIVHAGNNATPKSGSLITIHDRGLEKVVLSESSTIGDAIKEAGIIVDKNDVVEPALSQKLVSSEYQVNIYRARPVLIEDGNVRQKVVTAFQTPEQIVSVAGISLYPEDKTNMSVVADPSDGVAMKLTVDRAVPFNFNLFGTTSVARTQGETVAEMLAEKNIKLSKDDRVEPGLDTKITSEMTVKVWREGQQTVTVDEPIDFQVQRVENGDMDMSYRAVTTAGVKGSRSVTYVVNIQNGQVVSKKEIASLTTKQPVTQVEVVGVRGQYTSPTENENIAWNFFIGQGYTRIQTAGIMGNLMQENKFRTNGDGIAQWTGGRKAALYSLPYPNNIYTQLNFLQSELNGGYSRVNTALRSATTLTQAVEIFQNQFERCGICMEGNRIQYAQNILASH